MKALTDRVVVKEIKVPVEQKTEGGIIKTVLAAAHTKAEVIMVGASVDSVIKGDIVLFTANAGNPINIEGEEFILLRAEQLDVVF